MRLLSTGIAALAVTAFAIAPAAACSWNKSAQAKQMTVAETPVLPETGSDVAIATNDLSDAIVNESVIQPTGGETLSD
ncbi:hypothetical protein FMN63_01645 [Stappia sp. BW2]|jgi:hypothetical protein|uniref:hypothetical protein n=1 Tax=Stappia sp. BW2 TaxID=2592622 RepID=UPI0011DE613D|nr:hypothetical protein [Stappia sp. BW2]TYC79973.1 hypothetical protein FMN63_01645 [Stappia sp. BW2]